MAESRKVAMKTRGDCGQRRRLAPGGEPADEGTRVRESMAALTRTAGPSWPSHDCPELIAKGGGHGKEHPIR